MANTLTKAIVGATLLGTCLVAPASAQITVDPVDEVLATIGITGRNRPHIEYRERAPLVVPPSGAGLRPPEQRAAAGSARWPNDPDRASRLRKAQADGDRSFMDSGDESGTGRITRGRVERNRNAGIPVSGAYNASGELNPARALSRDQVSDIHRNADAQSSPGTGIDPGRRTLTDPPRGYRAAQGGRPIKSTVDPMQNSDRVEINVGNQYR